MAMVEEYGDPPRLLSAYFNFLGGFRGALARPTIRRAGGIFCLLLFIAPNSSGDERADEILDAIKRHDQSIRALDIEYEATQTFPVKEPWSRFPKGRTLSATLSGRLVFLGEKYRHQSEGRNQIEISAGNASTRKWKYANEKAFDGKRYIDLDKQGKRAAIRDSPQGLTYNPIIVGVMLTADRRLGSLTDLDALEWRYMGDEDVNGVNCHRLDSVDSNGQIERLWVDPHRGFRMMRFERETPRNSTTRFGDFEVWLRYEAKSCGEVAPKIWIQTGMAVRLSGIDPQGNESIYLESEFRFKVNAVNEAVTKDAVTLKIPPEYTVSN